MPAANPKDREPTEAMVEAVARAMQDADLHDGDEGNHYRLFDLLGFSGENKSVMVTRQLAAAALRAMVTASPPVDHGRVEKIAEQVRLFPEAYDTLTRQEMRDAKGNWRSLIDQQTNALAALRSLTNKDAA